MVAMETTLTTLFDFVEATNRIRENLLENNFSQLQFDVRFIFTVFHPISFLYTQLFILHHDDVIKSVDDVTSTYEDVIDSIAFFRRD